MTLAPAAGGDKEVTLDDGHAHDPLHLIVEIKGYRREDAKEKKSTMETYWVPGVNHLGTYGRWAFAELTDIYEISSDFERQLQSRLDKLISSLTRGTEVTLAASREFTANYLAHQLGADETLGRINDAIWQKVLSEPKHILYLSDLDEVARESSCAAKDVLPVLAVLSKRDARFLQLDLRAKTR